MLAPYDKKVFEIADRFDLLCKKCEEYERDYEEALAHREWDDREAIEPAPSEYRSKLLSSLKRGEKFILVRYFGDSDETTVPNGVTEIGSGAFRGNCTLRKIVLPDALQKIGNEAFAGCTALESVRFGENITSIGWNAFSECTALKCVRLPSALREISLGTFRQSGLESVYIPKTVALIDACAFSYCNSLKKIEIDARNAHYYARDNCVYDSRNEWLVVGRNCGALPVDGSFTEIGDDAFEGNLRVTELAVPSGVKGIGTAAFKDCKNLRRATLPDSLKTVGKCAFEGCAALEEISVPGSVKTLEEHVFSSSGIKKARLMRGVAEIEQFAFFRCADLREIYIPSSVKKISSPFDYCDPSLKIYLEAKDEKSCGFSAADLSPFRLIFGCDPKNFS